MSFFSALSNLLAGGSVCFATIQIHKLLVERRETRLRQRTVEREEEVSVDTMEAYMNGVSKEFGVSKEVYLDFNANGKIVARTVRTPHFPSPIQKGKPNNHGMLKCFSWFCGNANREIVQLAIADLSRDLKEMKKEGRRFWFIKAVLFWRTTATIVPITWDGIVRVVKAILPFAKYFKG